MESKLANPAPLGLMGFGMTTVLLNIHNAGFFPISAVILAMGIFYGGVAQVIAGIMEYRRGNTFGTTAFTSYGLFWISLVAIWVIPGIGLPNGGQTPNAFFRVVPAPLGCFHLLHVDRYFREESCPSVRFPQPDDPFSTPRRTGLERFRLDWPDCRF